MRKKKNETTKKLTPEQLAVKEQLFENKLDSFTEFCLNKKDADGEPFYLLV